MYYIINGGQSLYRTETLNTKTNLSYCSSVCTSDVKVHPRFHPALCQKAHCLKCQTVTFTVCTQTRCVCCRWPGFPFSLPSEWSVYKMPFTAALLTKRNICSPPLSIDALIGQSTKPPASQHAVSLSVLYFVWVGHKEREKDQTKNKRGQIKLSMPFVSQALFRLRL